MDSPNTNNSATVTDDVTITFRSSSDTKEKLQAYAEKDKRSMSNYINLVLEKHIAETEAA